MGKIKFDFKVQIKTKGGLAFIIAVAFMLTVFLYFAFIDAQDAADATNAANAQHVQGPQNSLDAATATYAGNVSTKRLHYVDCRYVSQISERNIIYFSSISEAIGYGACSVCEPH